MNSKRKKDGQADSRGELERHSSDEVNEILGRPPQWIIRWGITLIFAVIAILFIGSYFLKYPDVISASVVVTSDHMPAQIVAKTSGRIERLLVNNSQCVTKGQVLAVLENPTNFEDYKHLKRQWDAYHRQNADTLVGTFEFVSALELGELQASYNLLMKSYHDLMQFIGLDYHHRKIASIGALIKKQQILSFQNDRQYTAVKRHVDIATSGFLRDSLLWTEGVISTHEYELSRNAFLTAQYNFESSKNAVTSQQMSRLELEQQCFDLEQDRIVQHSQFYTAFINAKEQFFAQLSAWEQTYLLQSPVAGKVTFTNFFQSNQNINAGEVLLTVVPLENQKLIGKISLPQNGAGKVKVGQNANLKFSHFPHVEYGVVRVKIQNISLVPVYIKDQSYYILQVDFPNGLVTNYGKTLTFNQEMQGTAEIITEDLRLLDKFLNPIRSVLKR